MLSDLVQTLVDSSNAAADDVLLEALRLGNESERSLALGALLKRQTVRGLSGVVGQYNNLSASAQNVIQQNVKLFHHALRECGRGRDEQTCIAAMKLIALGRQGKLTYILSEGLHGGNDAVGKAACDAMVALARWVSIETRRLNQNRPPVAADESQQLQSNDPTPESQESARIYSRLMEERPEI